MANLCGANLVEANLSRANLSRANLSGANLDRAHLVETNLSTANLNRANLSGCNFDGAFFGETGLSNVDLSSCKGLELIEHRGPSSIDIRTVQRSGPLPLVFLRCVGLPGSKLIDYLPSLLDQQLNLSKCFISYSSRDEEFVRRLHADLQDKGVGAALRAENMKIGAKILDALDQAIRLHDKELPCSVRGRDRERLGRGRSDQGIRRGAATERDGFVPRPH